ncbi:5-methylcytosine-specific restriction endonuclease system specificity protein McrC [Anaerosporobacter sp.]|uniref:5-methylcytosine-specific restriction endonuclease system specificity protein McrC n=1 Tax=Anaerosporobacter sp. TaxID=1872529 RepID=UPI00286F3EA5|nr:5-methylcytosine-specific restriction endonuclease system specificity protein McrC [Anaerosporobacter sp.]
MANISIKNVYYMLSYAFRVLNEDNYHDIKTEEFEYTADLLAAILEKGLSSQIKRGLGREYVQKSDTIASPHGRIDFSESVKTKSLHSKKLVCNFDSYEENTYMNQVLKSTSLMLLHSFDVKIEHKKSLKRLILYLDSVEVVNLRDVKWKGFQYSKNNATYKMLINICYLVAKGLLLTDEHGDLKMSKYLDDRQMHNLYEKFILEYYKKHYPEFKPTASPVDWNVDDGFLELLPMMRTDITLEYHGRTAIIDAKYYSRMLQYNELYNSKTLHSDNMYQIFTYVKNKDVNHDGSVSGILLYAKTDEEEALDQNYLMSGNKISVKSIDLGQEFDGIKKTLDEIAVELY